MGKLVMVTGGSASGKSQFSEKLVREMESSLPEPKITYVATAEIYDAEIQNRVDRHVERRPQHWDTVEACHDLGTALTKLVSTEDIILLDSVSMYLSNKLLAADIDELSVSETISNSCDEFSKCIDYIKNEKATVVMVTDEVGWGLVPTEFLGRAFKDLVGEVNQLIAKRSDEAYLVVSGLAQKLK